MLDLEDRERKMLFACNALTLDDDGHEVLRGLTVSESRYVLMIDRDHSCQLNADEWRQNNHLKRLHRIARSLHSAPNLFRIAATP